MNVPFLLKYSVYSNCSYAWMNPPEGSIDDFYLFCKGMFLFIQNGIAFLQKSWRVPVTQGPNL